MEESNALSLVFARNAFYRRLHYLALGAFLLSLIVIATLISVIVYLRKNPAHPIYFATNNIGQLINIIPVDKPNMSTEDATAWAIEAVQRTYSYDFINFRSQLQDSQKYFTNFGWANYMKALKSSNNLVALQGRKQVVIAQVVGKPKLIAQGILGGSYAWKFEMPILVTYWEPPFDEKTKYYNPLEVSIIIQRQPPLQGYRGLGIVQLIAKFVTAPNQTPQISGTPTG